jgi:hypothetical protein
MLDSLFDTNTQTHWERLSPELRARADVAGSGELLWPLDAAIAVVRWLAEERLGILGGEVYTEYGQARGLFRSEWSTAPQWRIGEEWAAYVRRAEGQAAELLERERTTPPGEPARYFLAVAAEQHYPPFLRAA